MEEYSMMETAHQKGERLGLQVIIPATNELQIDLDTEEEFQHFQSMWGVWVYNGFGGGMKTAPSKSGYPHRHITITLLDDVTPWQRIALQAALGSDPKREILSAIRIYNKDPYPTAFLELKEETDGTSTSKDSNRNQDTVDYPRAHSNPVY
jgi:hypothetical protein